MIDLVILYDAGCPSLPLAHAAVTEAVRCAGVQVDMRELERADAPLCWRSYASPTVLVDGIDVAVGTACDGTACRLYADANGRWSGAPPVERIIAALERAARAPC